MCDFCNTVVTEIFHCSCLPRFWLKKKSALIITKKWFGRLNSSNNPPVRVLLEKLSLACTALKMLMPDWRSIGKVENNLFLGWKSELWPGCKREQSKADLIWATLSKMPKAYSGNEEEPEHGCSLGTPASHRPQPICQDVEFHTFLRLFQSLWNWCGINFQLIFAGQLHC